MSTQLETLTQINLDDLVSSFGWEQRPLLASALRRLFGSPARNFAGQMTEFDADTGRVNLAEASRQLMRHYYVKDVRVHGRENIPTAGPVLFLANHPGMADTISLFAAINRADLKIIALQRPFLVSLAQVTRQLFFIDGDSASRMKAVRQVAAHLRSGGAALTFPAGKIEPDPTVYEGAADSLPDWTDSAGVFMRFTPQTRIVPVLVSGVVWKKAARHWLTFFKRTRAEREKLAAALQLLAMVSRGVRPTTVHIRFAKPITVNEIGSTETQAIHQAVMVRMHDLLEIRTKEAGVSALYPDAMHLLEIGNKPSVESVY
ncbi:MAG TPA: 1-acyl-sn-glycerol-3-phosphate acyltransferase [Anaerolineales bacterium]|nr:1-acyl-sn-glycerol-3-phosphate acyltransferase [Anaerolineales bacterium]